MFRPALRLLTVAAFVCMVPAAARAQQRPTPEQARILLQTRPDLVAQLRQRLGGSGLSPEQVRARLRAEGYPADLLDAYLPGASGGAGDSTLANDAFAAVRDLGISDSLDFGSESLGGIRASGGVRSDTGAARGFDTINSVDAFGRVIAGDSSRAQDSRDAYDSRPRLTQAQIDSGLTIFGVDIFRRRTTQFDANLAGPIDASYRLGPGDRLVLILTGDVEQSQSIDVTREGFIVIPQVGQIFVNNLTLGQLEDVLYSRLARVYSGVSRGAGATTRFSISVARLRSNQVFVLGDVSRPGSYRVSSAGTALSALYASGGPTENGSLRRVEIRRGGRTVGQLDVYDYLLRGDASQDVRLQTGDVIFVPVHGPRVRVIGEVTRPATYEVKPGESLALLLQASGGLTATASTARVQIERILPPSERASGGGGRDRVVLDVSGDQLTEAGGASVPVQAGDVIRVFPVATRVRNRVTIRGNVWEPGTAGLTPGMKLSDALRSAGGVKPDVYLGRVLITRLNPDSTRVQLRATLRDTTGAVVNDVPLQEDDEIRVFSVTEFRPQRFVAIAGAVRRSGQYPYREGMTMRDLVLLAGGLRESAYLNEAEIARLPESRTNGTLATTIRTPLDSSYLFERTPDGRYSGPPGLPASSGSAPEMTLRPYDNVLILRQPDWELERTVAVSGEVRFPGRYALKSKNDRISDAIQRAGGLTNEGYAEGIVFFRSRDSLGRVGVELPSVLKNPKNRDNLLLADGDSLYVPTYNPIVNVTGAVNSPVATTYVPGADLEYYVRAAGGGSRQADLSRAFVTQPNGKVESIQRRRLLPDRVPHPRAGSRIVVPQRDPNDRRDYTALLVTAGQLIGSLVVIIVTLANLRK